MFFALVSFFLFCVDFISASENGIVSTVNVYINGKEDYFCYRIPAMIRNPKTNEFLAFAEGRKTSCSDHGYVDLVLKRSSDLGKTWEPLEIVHHIDEWTTVGNPVPIFDTLNITGQLTAEVIPLIVVYCVNNSLVMRGLSLDSGKTWDIIEITKQVKKPEWTSWYATGPTGGASLAAQGGEDAMFLVPCNHAPDTKNIPTRSHVIASTDGVNWSIRSELPKTGSNECQLVVLEDNSVVITLRNVVYVHNRYFYRSFDGAKTWKGHHAKEILEAGCEASLLRHDASKSLLFSNPCDTGRTHMCLHQSFDNGDSWKKILNVYEHRSVYSSLEQGDDGTVYLLFENGQETWSYVYLQLVTIQL